MLLKGIELKKIDDNAAWCLEVAWLIIIAASRAVPKSLGSLGPCLSQLLSFIPISF